jgi:H+/Na+-translocating ferredoxin:NAD+ oxidoreductase subunit E
MSAPSNAWSEAVAPVWRDNVALGQLLGLCPLLAVTTSLVQGLALGVATLAVIVVSSTTMSVLRAWLVPIVRVPLVLLILAGLVTCIDLLWEALLYDLHEMLGLFVPLIVVNSGLLAHATEVAARRSVPFTLVSALATGIGFAFALMALGALREVFGHGTLFGDVEMLAGTSSSWLTLDLPFDGMLVAILPPGAFFGIAVLLALRNRLAARRTRAAEPPAADPDQ